MLFIKPISISFLFNYRNHVRRAGNLQLVMMTIWGFIRYAQNFGV